MKKQLCMLAVMALASSAFAQGTVTFVSGSNLVRQQGLGDPAPVNVPVNGGFVQLLWNPNPDAVLVAWDTQNQSFGEFLNANSGWQRVPESIKAINGPVPGRFNGGTITVPTTTPGANIAAAVLGWSGNFATAEEAFGAQANMGVSSKFTVDTGNPNATPVADFPGTTSGAFTGMTLTPTLIPEPSTFALAGLGAAALLAMRRRK